jgi:hypothetical protein
MDFNILQILYALVGAASLIFFVYAIQLVHKFLTDKTGSTDLSDALVAGATLAVQAAQQAIGPTANSDKKMFALNILQQFLEAKKYKEVDGVLLNAAIESAVYQLKFQNVFWKPSEPIGTPVDVEEAEQIDLTGEPELDQEVPDSGTIGKTVVY